MDKRVSSLKCKILVRKEDSMSICTKFRVCKSCGHRYVYNPSVGDWGRICPKCGKFQMKLIDMQKTKT